MPEIFARKVDQQIAYADAMLALLAEAPSEFVQRALVQSAYLQLELGVAFYLAEITRRHQLDDALDENSLIDSGQLAALLERCAHTAEAQELQNLQLDSNSWWSSFLRQRPSFHSGEKHAPLKGSLFQTGEIEDNTSPFQRIGAVNIDASTRGPNAEDARWLAGSLRALVERQRSGDEEY